MEHRSQTVRNALSLISHFVPLEVVSESIAVQALDLDAIFRFFQVSMFGDRQSVECEVYGVDFDFVFASVGLQH